MATRLIDEDTGGDQSVSWILRPGPEDTGERVIGRIVGDSEARIQIDRGEGDGVSDVRKVG